MSDSTMLAIQNDQLMRRFQGTKQLYGSALFYALSNAHVYVIGVGGVGSWAAEGLARTAVGQMTLIDLDVLVASNINRQLPALTSSFGQNKITAMGQRLLQINPQLTLNLVDDFLTADNVNQLLPDKKTMQQKRDQGETVVILDCVDDMTAKLAIALHCRFNKLKLVCAGGAGAKTDPLLITVNDLKQCHQDPLLAKLRQKLRREKNINRKMTQNFGIRCVYSTQPPQLNNTVDSTTECQTGGLHCGGYGSAVAVTSVMGMVMVNEAIKIIANGLKK